MSNPFDQFDAPVATQEANPFDRFDANPFDKFDASPAQQSSPNGSPVVGQAAESGAGDGALPQATGEPAKPLTPEQKTKARAAYVNSLLPPFLANNSPEQLAALDVAGAARSGIDAQAASNISPGAINMEVVKKIPGMILESIHKAGGIEPNDILDKAGHPVKLTPSEDPSTTPIVTLPKPQGDGVGAGIARGLETVAESLTTPENVGLMGLLAGAPAVAQKVAAAGFGGLMAKGAYTGANELIDKWDTLTPAQRAESLTSLTAESAMAVLAAKHVTGDALTFAMDKLKSERVKADAASEAAPTPDEHPVGTIIDAGEGWGRYEKRPNGKWKEIDENGYVRSDSDIAGTPKGEVVFKPEGEVGVSAEQPATISEKASQFQTAKEFGDSLESSESNLAPNNKIDAPFTGKFEEGKHYIDNYGENPYIYEGRYVDPRIFKNNLKLEGDSYEYVRDMPTTQKYIEWYKEGHEPPAIDVIKKEGTGELYSTNRRRVIAALEAGITKIPALVEVGRRNDIWEKSKKPNAGATSGGIYPEPKETVAAPKIIPSAQALGVTHPLPPFLNTIVDAMLGTKIGDNVRGLANRLKGFVGTITGETFPNTTIADRASGELAARWVSSRIAAPFVADNFAKQVLEGTGVDPVKFGTALTEDNLRSVRQGFIDAGETDRANGVGSAIGGKNSPFKTESDYQAFLNDPAVKAALARHLSLWGEVVDPMYKKAMSLEPDTDLPSRGAQTGARINLHGIDPDAPVTNRKPVSTVAQGNPLGTLKKKSPFGRQATGTGTYNTDYNDMMANTFGRQLEIANKNAFEKQLVESGNAVIGKSGEKVTLPDGEETVPFPLKRQTLVMKGEGGTTTVPQSQSIFVRKSIAAEYRRGANIDLIPVPSALKNLGGVLNRAALAGLTDATVHVTNLAHVIFNRPGVAGKPLIDSLLSTFGRSDVPVTLVKALVKGFQDNTAQLSKLAEIGAIRAPHDAPATFNPLAKIGEVIQWADKATRLVMDDAFTRLAKEGLVEDTETNRREFINQVGQYNKRAQGDLMRLARDTGIGPFATAGRNFNVLGVKTLALDPGAKATSAQSAAILRANVLSKWVGGAVLIGSLNYLLTKDKGGGVMGRPGVKIGQIDTGTSDKNGRPLAINAIDLIGLGRGLRATGLRGAIEAKRNGLTNADAADSAGRDIYNTAISPFVGPVPKFVMGLGNKTPSIGVGSPHPIAAPGESQLLSNLKNSLIEANPVVASIADAQKPGADIQDTIRRQLPRFTLQPSNPPEMMDKYPEIVRRAQSSAFIDDVIGRARKLEPEARKQFLADSLKRLHSNEDRQHAEQRFKQRKVWVN